MPKELPDNHIAVEVIERLILAAVLGSSPHGQVGNTRGVRLALDPKVAAQASWPFGRHAELTTNEEVLSNGQSLVDANVCYSFRQSRSNENIWGVLH